MLQVIQFILLWIQAQDLRTNQLIYEQILILFVLVKMKYFKIHTWRKRCPSTSSPSATSSSYSGVGLPSSSCSSAHPTHAIIEHVGFVFEAPRPKSCSSTRPSYLSQLLVNLKALQTQLINLLWTWRNQQTWMSMFTWTLDHYTVNVLHSFISSPPRNATKRWKDYSVKSLCLYSNIQLVSEVYGQQKSFIHFAKCTTYIHYQLSRNGLYQSICRWKSLYF